MMRKIFNYFACIWISMVVLYFTSTFFYEIFCVDKINARADTLETVFDSEFLQIRTISDSEETEVFQGGYRLYLDKKNMINRTSSEVVSKIGNLAQQNQWILEDKREYEENCFFIIKQKIDNMVLKL